MQFIDRDRLLAQIEVIENGVCVHYMDIDDVAGVNGDETVEKTVFCKTPDEIKAVLDKAIDSRPAVLFRQRAERIRRQNEERERLVLEARANAG